jgi:hypothetical protein
MSILMMKAPSLCKAHDEPPMRLHIAMTMPAWPIVGSTAHSNGSNGSPG